MIRRYEIAYDNMVVTVFTMSLNMSQSGVYFRKQ